MSLFSAGAINALTGVVAKKSAEVAAASGALLASAGILIGAHGVGMWNSAHTVQSQATSARQTLFNTQTHLQNMEMRIKSLSQKMPSVCAASTASRTATASVCAPASRHAYSSITQNLRALYLDLPQWAAQNGVTLSDITSNQGLMAGPSTGAAPVPGYPGISQQVIKVSGAYSTLSGLHHFVQAMPAGIELTGITIQKKHFTGEITVYGITA